jgi:hypothetical protein
MNSSIPRAVWVVTFAALAAGTVAAQTSPDVAPMATMAQLMRGLFFPNANLIFDVQMEDPAKPRQAGDSTGSVTSTFSGIYTGWQTVENAALMLAEGGSLMNAHGRPCENGRMAPVQRWDWLKWSRELTEVSWQVYQAAQARDREAVSELTGNLAEACDNCHRVYRSNAQGNHLRCLGSGIVLPPQ